MVGARGLVLAGLLLLAGVLAGPAAGPAAGPGTPVASGAGANLAARLSVPPSVRQMVTVTSVRWSDTSAAMRVWRRRDGAWRLVRGPVRVALGWNGFVRARERRQGSGTTPAGRFPVHSIFGNHADPGSRFGYRRADRDDVWPYEPRDPATYNILQPSRAATTRWRPDYVERLADYGYEYAHAIVLGFNLPRGVHWSRERQQYVAREPADTRRGGGIFLHVREKRYTAGCVSAPLHQVRWLVRWLDPTLDPRVVMGPRAWLLRRY